MTDVDLLRRAGEALYGAEWQRPLARMLGGRFPGGPRSSVDDRTLRRIAAGQRAVPAWYWTAIYEELEVRRRDLLAAAREIGPLRRMISPLR